MKTNITLETAKQFTENELIQLHCVRFTHWDGNKQHFYYDSNNYEYPQIAFGFVVVD